MARRVNFIQEINASKDTWKLKVRVTGLWPMDRSSAPSIEMIFMDEKGDKIQAIVKNYHIAQWESQLHEGRSYIAENFEIVPNEGQYRCSNHSFKLIFQKGTIMKNKQLSEIPLYIFKFSTFEDILNGVATTDILVDVIGELINIEMSQPDSTPKKVVFIMRDQRGNSLSCTLWGQFATQFLKYEQDHKLGPIVLILTLAKIRDAKGGYPVTIQNTMYGSKLYINDNNIPEIQSFSSSKSYESYSQRMSQSSSCSQGGLQEKFFHNAVAKTIGEIIHVGQESVSVTYGTIDKLFANGWYYDGCSHCNRKTDAIRIPINCASCGRYLQEVVARYKVEVRVSYGHDSMKFVLWNRECEQLIKQPATDLRELLLSEGELNPMSIPQAVDDIVTNVLAFKVKVQPNYKRCSVIQVSDDSQLIACLLDKITPDVNTKTDEKGKSIANVGKEEDGFECQSLSGGADYDPEHIEYLTPLKRLGSSAMFDDTQDLVFAQMSSTENVKHVNNE